MSGLGVAGSSSVPRYVDGEGADTLTAGSLAAQPLTPAINTAAVSATNRRRPRAGRYDTRQAPFTLWYSPGLIVRAAGLHPTSSRTTASASSRPRRVSTARPAAYATGSSSPSLTAVRAARRPDVQQHALHCPSGGVEQLAASGRARAGGE